MHWYSDALSNQRDEVSTSAQSSASGRLRQPSLKCRSCITSRSLVLSEAGTQLADVLPKCTLCRALEYTKPWNGTQRGISILALSIELLASKNASCHTSDLSDTIGRLKTKFGSDATASGVAWWLIRCVSGILLLSPELRLSRPSAADIEEVAHMIAGTNTEDAGRVTMLPPVATTAIQVSELLGDHYSGGNMQWLLDFQDVLQQLDATASKKMWLRTC